MAEEAFREGLRGILEKLGFKVEKWSAYDEEDRTFGYPSEVKINITMKDDKLILIDRGYHHM